jgi:hypothetical protein
MSSTASAAASNKDSELDPEDDEGASAEVNSLSGSTYIYIIYIYIYPYSYVCTKLMGGIYTRIYINIHISIYTYQTYSKSSFNRRKGVAHHRYQSSTVILDIRFQPSG